jgi:hypothetical protein
MLYTVLKRTALRSSTAERDADPLAARRVGVCPTRGRYSNLTARGTSPISVSCMA